MGNLVFQATLGGQVNLVGPNTASTFNINVPATAGTMVTTGDTGTVSSTMLASSLSLTTPNINVATATTINGLTVGKGAGAVATNTAVGASALSANTTGAGNTALGYQAAYSTTTGAGLTAIGGQVLYNNTTGTDNVAVGGYRPGSVPSAMSSNTTGNNNVAVGSAALANNTTASQNTVVGYQAGYNSTGAGNTFVGYVAGSGASGMSGAYNTCVGWVSGASLTTGAGNTFIGSGSAHQSGSQITTGSKNTILGAYDGNQGGLDIRTANNYIVLSDGDGNPRQVIDSNGNFGLGNVTPGSAIASGFIYQPAWSAAGNGAFAVGHASGSAGGSVYASWYYNSGVIGSITQNGTTAIAYNTTSDYRLKENVQPLSGALARVAALKPCTYTWKLAPDEIGEGFIAHELAEVCPQAVTGEKDAVDEEGNAQYQSIDTSFLVATLTAAIQELKAEFDAYKATHP